jgi:hypothetical protein
MSNNNDNNINRTNKSIPDVDPNYVPWGHFKAVQSVLESGLFTPTLVTGLSGNGKTTMIEQVCAKTKRELFRVNITTDTDEDDLFGGFRLLNGETVWQDGPVIQAMERGAVLLLDEFDLGSSKIMCLQPVLEGKGVFLKKANRMVRPAPGFCIFLTANTKGKGSDDGRFIGTNVQSEALLDRISFCFEQEYASKAIEKKILMTAMRNLEGKAQYGRKLTDENFIDNLVTWGAATREGFEKGANDEVISTRRLVDICKAHAVFNDKETAIRLCLSRFDKDTSEALFTLYTKFDDTMVKKSSTVAEDIANQTKEETNG